MTTNSHTVRGGGETMFTQIFTEYTISIIILMLSLMATCNALHNTVIRRQYYIIYMRALCKTRVLHCPHKTFRTYISIYSNA